MWYRTSDLFILASFQRIINHKIQTKTHFRSQLLGGEKLKLNQIEHLKNDETEEQTESKGRKLLRFVLKPEVNMFSRHQTAETNWTDS